MGRRRDQITTYLTSSERGMTSCDNAQRRVRLGDADTLQSASTMIFQSEKNLVDRFVSLLQTDQTPWGKVTFSREFDYSRGRTDVIAVAETNTVIAVEAKLEDWKYALHQAYRNTCFAHHSFVLLPKKTALTAMSFLAEFERRSVGLCYIDEASLVVLHDSPRSAPLEPWLASEAISRVRRSNRDTCQPQPTPWNQ
jgi:hypothetical protein